MNPANPTSDRPNILWISLEDTTPRFGCYGDPLANTPHLDRLAAEGVRYPNAFSTAGVCAPSRASIITGMYSPWLGTHHMRTSHCNRFTPEMPTPYSAVLPHYVKPFTEYLRAAGYFCTNCKKTDYQFDPPFTAWDELGNEAHWRNREPGQPFFAVFNPTWTHESGMWPEKTPEVSVDPDRVRLPPYLPDTPKTRLALARQYHNLARDDDRVGELLRQLEEDGLAGNTIVFIWSDHGEGLPRSKRWLYDGGIRVPLIVRWPGQVEAGSICQDLVSLIDLGPTVLSLSGVERPRHLQGQPFLGPKAEEKREYIFAARDRFDEAYDMVRAVRDKRYKYIRNFYPEKPYLLWIPYRNRHPILEEMWRLHRLGELEGPQNQMFQRGRPSEELYDVESDPFETTNLARETQHRVTLLRMRGVLEDWRKEFDRFGDISEEEMVSRWYPGGEQPITAAPTLIPLNDSFTGVEAANQGGDFNGPVLLQIHCATHGASIGYTMEAGGFTHWNLYTDPLVLPTGKTMIRTKAIRIGYRESAERRAIFAIRAY